MKQRYQDARLDPLGSSIVLGGGGQAERRVRHTELVALLGLPAFPGSGPLPVLGSPRVDDDALEFQLDGQQHRMPLASLARVRVFKNSSQVMSCTGQGLGLVPSGAVVCVGDTIAWVGPLSDISQCGVGLAHAERIDVQGRLLSPGLVDCHAHPLFAGERSGEFERRVRGDSYLDIAREGGGIRATVEPTRAASIADHVSLTHRRLERALAWGTTSMEAKSGYDLRVAGELRLLHIARLLDALQPVSLSPTLLGAHALPVEYADDRAGYIAAIAEDMIPQAASQGLADAVDVYCDEGAFTLQEMRAVLEAARRHGLRIKAHVGQFADLGGPQLLAELGALSADHLEQVSAEGMAAMAKAGVVATMLPGACVQLGMKPPPVAALRKAGVAMALASDLNPGTSHSETLGVPMWLGCTHYGMTVEEVWLGVTRHAAAAMGDSRVGRIEAGMRADLVVWDAERPAEIPSHFAVNLVHSVYKDGLRRVG